MHPYLNIAIKAARSAGKIISRHLENVDNLKIYEKGLNDFVTLVDKAAEEEIIAIIQKAYPNHSILGEETGYHEGDEFVWVIDPLDGTMNFLHGFPHFAVSIGIKQKDQLEHAVIFDPINNELFTASRGAGAQLNDRRLRVSKQLGLERALIGASFPFHDREAKFDAYLKLFKKVYLQCGDVRKTGSAALNLAYVAAGRLDGCWETGVKEWDIAAGALLVKEAGGFISDFKNEDNYLKNGNVVAGTRKVHMALLKIIEEQI